MATEVVVRISPVMFREDVAALQAWLEQRYPVGWDARREAGGDSLSVPVADIVLVAALAGFSEALAKEVTEQILERIKHIATRYPNRGPAPATVEARVLDETPGPAAAGEPGDTDRDTD